MLYTVKIWDNELKCDICSSNKWFQSTLKTDFLRAENASEYNEEVRYMFECQRCGNCKIFGMVSKEGDTDVVNITTIPISLS
ncbi:hypothetical protein AWH56_021590 [Anaerobacillus isosaccharinicus]|uniref:Uncharacterized protein n=1 Tax=Anaerobacillus isosaccharinicus TaxID=1532552 RepID=A0A1S2MF10_9BACI|nr:hypothetical protein [Anaerobacillus isosaccharinicus]MBA5586502.1 hypothetical protein [Anaerobacillus isosaccharinicus]QOY35257.1 hypothetical protein AWH56_021590 [Anaerobacillus isosaccharinicus]